MSKPLRYLIIASVSFLLMGASSPIATKDFENVKLSQRQLYRIMIGTDNQLPDGRRVAHRVVFQPGSRSEFEFVRKTLGVPTFKYRRDTEAALNTGRAGRPIYVYEDDEMLKTLARLKRRAVGGIINAELVQSDNAVVLLFISS